MSYMLALARLMHTASQRGDIDAWSRAANAWCEMDLHEKQGPVVNEVNAVRDLILSDRTNMAKENLPNAVASLGQVLQVRYL